MDYISSAPVIYRTLLAFNTYECNALSHLVIQCLRSTSAAAAAFVVTTGDYTGGRYRGKPVIPTHPSSTLMSPNKGQTQLSMLSFISNIWMTRKVITGLWSKRQDTTTTTTNPKAAQQHCFSQKYLHCVIQYKSP